MGRYRTGQRYGSEPSGSGRSVGATGEIVPLVPPTLLPSQGSRAGFQIRNNDTVQMDVIKLSIKFRFKNGRQGNLYFKRFLIVLSPANIHILLEKYAKSDENSISKAIDIAYDKSATVEYYAGMKPTNDKRGIIRYTKMLSNERLYTTKQHPQFRKWLATNHGWIHLTTFSLSNHVKVG